MMRSGVLIHVLGVLVTIGCLLNFWSSPLAVLFQSRSGDAIPPQEIAPGIKIADEDLHIPKIIHQVFNMWDNGTIPEDWKVTQESCLSKNKDYEYMLWDYASSREFISSTYPRFLNTFDSYKYPVQRADAIRYFLLAHFGGIYLDLDTGCNLSLDALRQYSAFIVAAPSIGLSNSIMGSTPGHSFYVKAVNRLQAYAVDWYLPYLTIMNSAGPHFISLVWIEYLRSYATIEECDRLRLLMGPERQGNPWSVFYSVRGSSWHNWDNLLFRFVHNHIFLIVTLLVVLVVSVACTIWWLVWMLYCRSYTNVRNIVGRKGGRGMSPYDFEGLPLWNMKREVSPPGVKGTRID